MICRLCRFIADAQIFDTLKWYNLNLLKFLSQKFWLNNLVNRPPPFVNKITRWRQKSDNYLGKQDGFKNCFNFAPLCMLAANSCGYIVSNQKRQIYRKKTISLMPSGNKKLPYHSSSDTEYIVLDPYETIYFSFYINMDDKNDKGNIKRELWTYLYHFRAYLYHFRAYLYHFRASFSHFSQHMVQKTINLSF